MAKSNTVPIAFVVMALGGGVWYYLSTQKDKTPVGLVVINAIEGGASIGETSDGKALTAGAVEGTWRTDEDSLTVASESAEKPLLVVYEDGTPVSAEVITMSEWVEGETPTECEGEGASETTECHDAITKATNDRMELWRAFAKGAGATEESVEANFPTQEESTAQEAESIFGPMLSLQSHFVW